jgi:hypothetical protein
MLGPLFEISARIIRTKWSCSLYWPEPCWLDQLPPRLSDELLLAPSSDVSILL